LAVGNQVIDAGDSANVGNLVRVTHASHRAMGQGQSGEFGGEHHGTFNVYMGVDQAGYQVLVVYDIGWFNAPDEAVFQRQDAVVDAPGNHIDNMTG